MECGYCEHVCPSRNLTLTPRQRIVVRREIQTLKKKGDEVKYKELLDQYQYDGMDTCAVDGLCATACPVDINTGDLIKRLRKENHNDFSNKVALQIAKNFSLATSVAEWVRLCFRRSANQKHLLILRMHMLALLTKKRIRFLSPGM